MIYEFFCVSNSGEFVSNKSTLKNCDFRYTKFLKHAKKFFSLRSALKWYGYVSHDGSVFNSFKLHCFVRSFDGSFVCKDSIDVSFYV